MAKEAIEGYLEVMEEEGWRFHASSVSVSRSAGGPQASGRHRAPRHTRP
jgi:hypothetical protein